MIDARELRVGNILHYKTSEGEILPTTIDWQEEYLFQFTSGNVHKFKGLKYLHQLQNLFYALTGTDLEYKPKGA